MAHNRQWTNAEIAELEAGPAWLRNILWLVLDTGLRPSDICVLSRSEHVRGDRIIIKQAKTSEFARVQITPRVRQILDEMPDGQNLIAVDHRGEPFPTSEKLRFAFFIGCDQLGIPKDLTLNGAWHQGRTVSE